MTDEDEVYTTIYVLPTEPGLPPRAMLGASHDAEEREPTEGEMRIGVMAIWTADMGTWTLNGLPVVQELSDAITEHARELGVPGFVD